MKGLTGKVAIVTGGSSGIGRAVVEEFAKYDMKVTFSGISEAGLQTAKELREKGADVQFFRGDMSEELFCHEMANKTIERWGKVNILINNAFSFTAKGLEATRKDWLRVMTVGPIGYATMIQAVLESMKEQGGGAIVNMSSISAHIAQPDRWTYNAAKGAVNQLTRCAALDLAPYHIRVNTLSPGWIWTREVDKAANYDREKWEPVWGKFHMMRRLGTVEEVASATAFLCSDEASFITAAELPVDGGYLGMGSEGLGESSGFAGTE